MRRSRICLLGEEEAVGGEKRRRLEEPMGQQVSLQFRVYTFFGQEAQVDDYHNSIKIFIYFQSVAAALNKIGAIRRWSL